MSDISYDKILGPRPAPRPHPKPEVAEERPQWDFSRVRYNLPVDKGDKPWSPIGTQPDNPNDPDWRGVVRNNVIELPMPGEYKFGAPEKSHYFWFDTPDYADPFKKLWYSFKFFAFSGISYMCIYGMLKVGKFNLKNHLMLMRKITIPWTLAGLAGSATVITLANLRGKKDDIYNYLPAGMAASMVLAKGNGLKFARWGTPVIPAALFVKHNAERNGFIVSFRRHRAIYTPMSLDTEHGFASGDLRFGFRSTHGDPGRDVRTPY